MSFIAAAAINRSGRRGERAAMTGSRPDSAASRPMAGKKSGEASGQGLPTAGK